jgi:hypothetical protein
MRNDLSLGSVLKGLKTNLIGKNILYYPSIPSTLRKVPWRERLLLLMSKRLEEGVWGENGCLPLTAVFHYL